MPCFAPLALHAADRAADTDTDTVAPSGEDTITIIITTTDRVPVPDRADLVQAVPVQADLAGDIPVDSAAAEAAALVVLEAAEAAEPAADGVESKKNGKLKTRVCVHGHRPFL